jgi:hypothetical protein
LAKEFDLVFLKDLTQEQIGNLTWELVNGFGLARVFAMVCGLAMALVYEMGWMSVWVLYS